MVAWANPSRRLNRAFGVFSAFVAAWLFCQWQASRSENGLWWVRMACALAVGVVVMMWLVKQTTADPDAKFAAHFRKMPPWLIVGLVLIWICFTSYFVPAASTSDRRLYGWGYFAYIFMIAGMVLGIFAQTLFQMRVLSGARKLELQLLLLGSIAAAFAVVGLMILGATTGNPGFNRAQSVFVFAFYIATSWAIVTTRVLDARYMAAIGLAKLAQSTFTAMFGWCAFKLIAPFVPDLIALLAAVGASLWFTAAIEPAIRRAVGLNHSDAESRNSAYEVARRESRLDRLEAAFIKMLQAWSKSERVVIMTGGAGGFSGAGLEFSADSMVLRALRQLRWASPERLGRERPTEERNALLAFLNKFQLGAVVISEGPALSAIVGVGIAVSRRPFTYPQITQLLELASIIESAMERAHFAIKVQHAEQLATVGLLGASLAHEIRNPLVTIKTFVQLLPQHHGDPKFRDKFFRLITDEVDRIDQLTEQLLDLASPRTYTAESIALHPVLRTSLDLVTAKAAHRNVQFVANLEASPDTIFTDPSAAKQVMLNLCFNAIQALDAQTEGPRCVWIATRNTGTGVEMAVTDTGPGIAPDMVPRLFQPFQTTKSTGFGLGLAICSDILANLNASITVDPPIPGQGATFRVIFPCQPSLS
jgi:signal transduction histidine kinase